MAANLKEYFRESIKQYLKVVKDNTYSKDEVDAIYNDLVAADVSLDGFTVTNYPTLPTISPGDTAEEAFRKLEYITRTITQTLLPLKADLVGGKVPLAQLPDTITGSLEYKGVWDAGANVPDINAAPEKGDYYVVSSSGNTALDGEQSTDWQLNDWAVYDGTAWSKLDRTPDVVVLSGESIVAPFDDVTPTEATNDWNNA